MKKTQLFILASILLTAGCSQTEESIGEGMTLPPDYRAEGYLDPEKETLDDDDAMTVASLFCRQRQGAATRSNSFPSEEIQISTISDQETASPLLYIVNYGTDKGFVVISASKKTSPILAYAREGHLDVNDIENSGMACYLEDYRYQVSQVLADTSDSLRIAHAIEWARFEKGATLPENTRIISEDDFDVNAMMQAEIQRRTAEGYRYIGTLPIVRNYIPLQDYNQLVNDIATHAHPSVDYEATSLFFVRDYTPYDIQPLINVEWHQDCPFNVDAPNGIAGCVPIAVAQILYYYQYPTYFDWANIPSAPNPNAINNPSFCTFIKDVRNKCRVEYKEGKTSSNIDKAKKALEDYGYSVTKYNSFNRDAIKAQIIASRPVYMRGVSEEGEGHAWICEGYRKHQFKGIVSMIPDKPVLRYTECEVFDKIDDYFYMAFGQWQGDGNGWFFNIEDDTDYPNNHKCLTIHR